MTEPRPATPAADDDTRGRARLARFEDCASAIDGRCRQAPTTTGACAVAIADKRLIIGLVDRP
jgi:hypothetical protein